jgi:hypothetical protein
LNKLGARHSSSGRVEKSAWGEIFGDEVTATAIDRLVQHAEILSLNLLRF